MSVFDNCTCSWCRHSKYKLISYTQCKKCSSLGFYERISRIDISPVKTSYSCGFLCSICFSVVTERYSEVANKNPISLSMCRCSFCATYRNIYEINGYCKICNMYRNLCRIKRVDKSQSSILKRCGFICSTCNFFHIEMQQSFNRSIGKVNCFGI